MPTITTQSVSDPKPARGINWTGQPMRDGEDYWGNPISETSQDAPQTRCEAAAAHPSVVQVSRRHRRSRRATAWTAERRKALSEKIKAMWRAKRQET